jgi:outer membrane lipoprotein-sorting protein
MSELSNLLELLYRARSSWRTVRLAMREWVDYDRARRAFARFQGHTQAGLAVDVGGSARAGPFGESICTVRTWAAADGRFREERTGGTQELTLVSDGRRTWIYTPQSGAIVHEDWSTRPGTQYLLDPTQLIAHLDLEPVGHATAAGRGAVAVRARPRRQGWYDGEIVPPGADELDLLVDEERGVVLRHEARFEREPFRVAEVTEIVFDEPLPEERFAFEPPPGEEVRTAAEAYRSDYLSIEETARRASFTIWVPARLAPEWRLHALYRPASERPRLSESVHLLFHDGALHQFAIEEAGERLLAWRTDEPEVVTRDGVRFHVLPGSRPGPPTELHLERGGTHIRISSDTLERDALVEVAATLVPAPTEPPVVAL